MNADLGELCDAIASFLEEKIVSSGGRLGRVFYGEAFSLAFLASRGRRNPQIEKLLLEAFSDKTKDPEYHWEFNNYGIMRYSEIIGDSKAKELCIPLRFKGTSCTNWSLLRIVGSIGYGERLEAASLEAKRILARAQLPSGLIVDDPGVKSFHYHCFSAALVIELFDRTGDRLFHDAFIDAMRFIRQFILSNGETLYIGRGQNQIFGYGILLYILARYFRETADISALAEFQLVAQFVRKFRRADGSLPLILNGNEDESSSRIRNDAAPYLGWYQYNNYYDYLPFFGFFASEAEKIAQSADAGCLGLYKKKPYRDCDFLKFVTDSYEAVVSRPGGYITNDLPIPFVVTQLGELMPYYGGDEYSPQVKYSPAGLPLPYFPFARKSIRWHGASVLRGDVLYILSPMGFMKRRFSFLENEVLIDTLVLSVFPFEHRYLVKEQGLSNVRCSVELELIGKEPSASGALELYRHTGMKSRLRILIK